MKRLHAQARPLLDGYLDGLRRALRGSADAAEVERDVRDHIEVALAGSREPVSAPVLQAVLERIGEPAGWGALAAPAADRPPAASVLPERQDWHLAYLSLGLLMLAFALPPYWWIGVLGAFVAARASYSLSASQRADATHAAQQWLRWPAMLVVYVPLLTAAVVWPAIAVRFAADAVVANPELALQLPIELAWAAERIACIRLSHFDPVATFQHVVRSGHYLIAPVGLWLIAVSCVLAARPRPLVAFLKPLLAECRHPARAVFLAGGLLCGFAALQAMAKLTG